MQNYSTLKLMVKKQKDGQKILIDNDHWVSICFYFSEMSADICGLDKIFLTSEFSNFLFLCYTRGTLEVYLFVEETMGSGFLLG